MQDLIFIPVIKVNKVKTNLLILQYMLQKKRDYIRINAWLIKADISFRKKKKEEECALTFVLRAESFVIAWIYLFTTSSLDIMQGNELFA